MRRRETGGKTAKTQRRKTLKRRNAPKAVTNAMVRLRAIIARHEASAGQLTEDTRTKPRDPLAATIHNPQFAHVIANAINFACQTHLLRDFVTKAPKVDHIVA